MREWHYLENDIVVRKRVDEVKFSCISSIYSAKECIIVRIDLDIELLHTVRNSRTESDGHISGCCRYYDNVLNIGNFRITACLIVERKSDASISLRSIRILTDYIFLSFNRIVGERSFENGFYTAAITCACVVQFVYTAIIDSMRPVILECKQKNTAEYEKKLSTLYCIVIYMSLAQSVVFTLFAKLIVAILYGAQYMPTVSILRVLVWYVVFSYMGAVRNIWILAEGKHKFLWKINLAGALANILLNSVLIPFYGALGAAIASLVTQFFTNFILGFIIKAIRPNNRLLLKGLNPKLLLSLIKEYKK